MYIPGSLWLGVHPFRDLFAGRRPFASDGALMSDAGGRYGSLARATAQDGDRAAAGGTMLPALVNYDAPAQAAGGICAKSVLALPIEADTRAPNLS